MPYKPFLALKSSRFSRDHRLGHFRNLFYQLITLLSHELNLGPFVAGFFPLLVDQFLGGVNLFCELIDW